MREAPRAADEVRRHAGLSSSSGAQRVTICSPIMASLPPIWVVSLERAAQRRAFVRQAFADVGLPYELVDAVDGTALTSDDRRAYSRTRALYEIGRELMAGELGCARSHLGLLRRLVDEGHPDALVVEDDVAPGPHLEALLRERDQLPADRDVITYCRLSPSADPVPVTDLAEGFRLVTYRRIPFGAQCYLITRRAAQEVLAHALPVCMPFDELLLRTRPVGLRVYGVEPRAVRLQRFTSELVARPDPPSEATLAARMLTWPVAAAGGLHRRARRVAGGSPP
jgi:glycosyl transferase family 25